MQPATVALLLTDVVDSTRLSEELGDRRMAVLWALHDRLARDLLPPHRGREIDKTDGMLLLFEDAADAVAYALAYHRGMAALSAQEGVELAARAGLHVGEVLLRENRPEDVALGAKPLEVEGLAKPTAARIMSLATGGQTLVSGDALEALGAPPPGQEAVLHGHYQLKGVAEPVPLYELGAPGESPFLPPADGAKVYRVVRHADGRWEPARELPHNLPAVGTSFVGRTAVLRDLARRVAKGQRLITLMGPGGTGKSRLSVEFARRWRGDFPGGTWFVPLEEVSNEEGLVAAVANTLGIRITAADRVGWVGAMLAEREPTLVILDNFEQLVACAGVVGRWVQQAPACTWLVSSRERLQVATEHVLPLEALDLPPAGAPVEAVLASPAVQLFADRARAVSPRFSLDAAMAGDVGELVRLLDGMPLAIELAAARVAMMSPGTMVQRMGQRFRLLTSKRRDVTHRQATLQGAIDWSWQLLEPAERLALAQCSVFRGGFTLAAAEAVLDLEAWPDAPWPEDAVQGLVDKSLLRVLDPEALDPVFGFYQSIRDYAAERMADPAAVVGPEGEALTGPEAARLLRLRHAQHYAADVEARLARARRSEGLASLVAVRDNLEVAFDGALEADIPSLAADAFALYARVCEAVGPSEPAIRRFSRLPLDELGPDARCRCLEVQHQLLFRASEPRVAVDTLRVAHWEALGDERMALWSAIQLATSEGLEAQAEAARARRDGRVSGPHGHEVALRGLTVLEDRVRALGDRELLGHYLFHVGVWVGGEASRRAMEESVALLDQPSAAALYNLGCLYVGIDDHDAALQIADRVDATAERAASAEHARMLAANLRGQTLARLGRWDEAEAVLRHGKVLAERLGNRLFACGGFSMVLTTKLIRDGRLDEARELLGAARTMQRLIGNTNASAWGLSNEARLALAEGDVAAARAAIDEAYEVAPEVELREPAIGCWVAEARQAVEAAEAGG